MYDEGKRKNLPVSCHSQEWAVFIMMLKYTWGNGEVLWAAALVGVALCIRETHFSVTSARGIQACETYPRTLPFDQTDLPPLWHLEAEIYIKKKWVFSEEFLRIVGRKLNMPLSLRCVALSTHPAVQAHGVPRGSVGRSNTPITGHFCQHTLNISHDTGPS